MTGAVDLAAVKARSEAAARAAEAPGPAPGNYVVDVTEASFQAEVLDRSFQVPVLIDLWADWCQPCKQLSPILERLANAAGGAWVLAKIDTEANPRIAQALQVQSIPTVYAVIGGQLIPGFQGALPEAQVREFIDAVLSAAREAGLPTASEPPPAGQDAAAPEPELPEDPRFTAAEDALAAGDLDLAAQRYQAILDQEPANQEAGLALGQVRLLQRLDNIDRDAAQRADSAPDDVDAQLAAADLAFANNDVSGALDRLLATVARTSGDDRERVRARLLEYFDLLGPDDPRVSAARRQLARALF
ncbi:MAG TPA: tetratricopeptide repeat protein [Jatrophihabitans sp.]|nr:tetratricopeptide repeat protein [Jatrophihabitans sp.]